MNEDLINRITYHLSSGGLFNPELADHLAVRNLLMECRDTLAQPEQKFDTHSVPGKSRNTHSRQPEQEPVGEIVDAIEGAFKCSFTKMLPVGAKLYTTPPQRKPLTNEEIERIYDRYGGNMTNCARAIERAHGIKENT